MHQHLSKSGIASQALVMILAVVFAVGIGTIYFVQKEKPYPNPFEVACPQDAKLCPDGSAVGRTSPNCEFALCLTDSSAKAPATVEALCEGGECPIQNSVKPRPISNSIFKSIRDVDFQTLIAKGIRATDAGEDCEVNTSTDYIDLTSDGIEDAFIYGSSCLSGQGIPVDINEVYTLDSSGHLINLPIDYTGAPGRLSGLGSSIEKSTLFTHYYIYNLTDGNCCPTGGGGEVYLKWNGAKFVVDRIVELTKATSREISWKDIEGYLRKNDVGRYGFACREGIGVVNLSGYDLDHDGETEAVLDASCYTKEAAGKGDFGQDFYDFPNIIGVYKFNQTKEVIEVPVEHPSNDSFIDKSAKRSWARSKGLLINSGVLVEDIAVWKDTDVQSWPSENVRVNYRWDGTKFVIGTVEKYSY